MSIHVRQDSSTKAGGCNACDTYDTSQGPLTHTVFVVLLQRQHGGQEIRLCGACQWELIKLLKALA